MTRTMTPEPTASATVRHPAAGAASPPRSMEARETLERGSYVSREGTVRAETFAGSYVDRDGRSSSDREAASYVTVQKPARPEREGRYTDRNLNDVH